MSITESTEMTSEDLTNALMELIEWGNKDTDLGDAMCRSFSEAGLLTNEDGIVLRLAGGSEFQITIVPSR